MRRLVIVSIFLCLYAVRSHAQKVSLSTNLVDYACLGTINSEVSYSMAQHWSITAGVRYNPFTFNEGDADRQIQYRQQSYAIGFRFWPWHTYSGWWMAGKVRYQEYNHGGILSREAEEGDRVGFGLYAGYTYMVSRHFNVEFGVGIWTGMSWYRRYTCPSCGLTVAEGKKWFLLPDDMMISLSYVF